MQDFTYRGRFAPSPSGPLHFGSLVAAVGSFLDARAAGGEWLVRIEDLDPPREIAGAADDILRTLDRFGLHWDGPVMYQSQRGEAYQQALEDLSRLELVYHCGCTRKELQQYTTPGAAGLVYPGTCRKGLPPGRKPRSVRVHVVDAGVQFTDRLQGPVTESLSTSAGDFVIRRADGLFAYQLAVVIDDAAQQMTDIVRGADLLDSTGRQIYLQQVLQLPTPRYMHLPVAVNRQGEKLSKQTYAPALDPHQTVLLLCAAMRFLGQHVPTAVESAGLEDFWRWATQTWDPRRIPCTRSSPAPAESVATGF